MLIPRYVLRKGGTSYDSRIGGGVTCPLLHAFVLPTPYHRSAIRSSSVITPSSNRPVPTPTTRVFGYSTKWADKRDSAKQSLAKWNAEPVELKTIDAAALRKLAANDTENFRLINVWSTSCPPCIAELPDYVTINRMYRGRHFELITLTTEGGKHGAEKGTGVISPSRPSSAGPAAVACAPDPG